jgi:predicted chitinase
MTKEQLARWRELGFAFDDFHDTIAVDTKPEVSIKFISAKQDDKQYNVKVAFTAKNCKTDIATISLNIVPKPLSFLEFAMVKNVKFKGDTNTYEFKFDLNPFASNKFADVDFIATLSIDGLEATSNVFQIEKRMNDKEKIKTCYCNRDFTVDDLKDIVINLRNKTFYAGKSITYYHKDFLFYKEEEMPNNQKTFEKFTQVINDTFNKYEINTCIRKIHFLSQSYSETGYFTRTKENGENLKYDPYRGRGFIQLTAAKNKKGDWVAGIEDSRTHNKTSYLGYENYSGVKVVSNPNLISESIYISSDSAGWFWKNGKLLEDGSILDLNLVADKDDINRLSKLINGGAEALKQRIEAYNALKIIFSYDNCKKNK